MPKNLFIFMPTKDKKFKLRKTKFKLTVYLIPRTSDNIQDKIDININKLSSWIDDNVQMTYYYVS